MSEISPGDDEAPALSKQEGCAVKHVDYLGRNIAVGDILWLLQPARTRTVEALSDDGIVALTPSGERVLLTQPRCCILQVNGR